MRYSVLGYTPDSVAAMLENLVYLELLLRGYEVSRSFKSTVGIMQLCWFRIHNNIGMKQILDGKVIDADIVMERIRDEYGFRD